MLIDAIEIRDNPIAGGAKLCQNVCFAIEQQGMAPGLEKAFPKSAKTKEKH